MEPYSHKCRTYVAGKIPHKNKNKIGVFLVCILSEYNACLYIARLMATFAFIHIPCLQEYFCSGFVGDISGGRRISKMWHRLI